MPPSAQQNHDRTRGKHAEMAPPEPSESIERAGTIALLGRPNVGKSTLLNALLGERIAITSPRPQTTRDRIAGILTQDGTQFVFLDTPGFHSAQHRLGVRMNELASAAASECDVAIFMTDVGSDPAPSLRPEDRAVLATIPAKTPTVLVVNKVDRVKPKSRLFPVLEEYAKARDFVAVVPLSALKSNNVDRLLGAIGPLLPAGDALFPEDELTDKPVRFFVSEYVREQVLRRTHQEVPHGVAVTVESFEEGARLVRIAVTIHVAKESHKAILIGDGGQMIAGIGAAARRRAEQLVGRKIFLDTRVRTTPGWFDDPARLSDLGYADEDKPKRRSRPRGRRRGGGAKSGAGARPAPPKKNA